MRYLLMTAVAALAATAVISTAAVSRPSELSGTRARPAVEIAGSVAALYPGAAKRVRLRLHNRSPRPQIVTAVRARVLGAAPGCPARSLLAPRQRLRLRIPARSQRRIRYPIAMSIDAADGCQGVTFPLRYRARLR